MASKKGIVVTAIIALLIARLAKFEITFAEILKVGLYASTLMVLGVIWLLKGASLQK